VTNGLAGMKFSASISRAGSNKIRNNKALRKSEKPKKSLALKYQWKGTASAKPATPNGLLLPV